MPFFSAKRDSVGALVPGEGGFGYYAKAHAALTAGVPYIVNISSESISIDSGSGATATTSSIAVTAATTAVATTIRRIGVPQKSYASGDIAFLLAHGEGKMYVEGTTDVAAGDFLKVAPGTTATAAIKDGTAETNSSVAMALEAQADNSEVLTDVFLCTANGKVVNT